MKIKTNTKYKINKINGIVINHKKKNPIDANISFVL
jgi:hypothetical protein